LSVSLARREPARQSKQSVLETRQEDCELLGAERPHFRPHTSATPQDETDSEQPVSLKTNDMRIEGDTVQPIQSSS
jgi:hypothetical protein